jgi:hypothetical protein
MLCITIKSSDFSSPPPHGCYMPSPSILLYLINRIMSQGIQMNSNVHCKKNLELGNYVKVFNLQHIISENCHSENEILKQKEL